MLQPFELDPQIIHHIIYNQAGSIGKALIELIMNSVDAGARTVRLTMTKSGFECTDDGRGFASREDVVRYFGRFGTPHQEGDATYGRFRLGRGQIMAHAKTHWFSNSWTMAVDTKSMGYNYDLEEVSEPAPGCRINGTWYEALNDQELMSCVQEIRDLVRYTPVSVELNGRVITRDPAAEQWDFEDDVAYYRAKEEGPVGIYNQGVLVRNDSSHTWGAGGLIVSKKAIDLNVSRTEILRKTCPVWKVISKQFTQLAKTVSARLGDHRKTEARRAKSAHALLSGDADIGSIFAKEEVITVLPGKRHITLMDFIGKAWREHKGTYTVVSRGSDIPKGEGIAGQRIIQVLHPQTLERFGCHNVEDFADVMARVVETLVPQVKWYRSLTAPEPVAFATLKAAFIERTLIVDEKTVLDKETCRAWIALRWCLMHYAGACAGADCWSDGTLRTSKHQLAVLLGESNTAEAWTDGKTYLAINSDIVKQIKKDPLKTVAYIFGLVEHEVAHQGDSLECGHDEAFYQRFHDITLSMAQERQRFIHKWLMKYTTSMEKEGKKATGGAWQERYLVDRVGSGRIKRGLSPAIEDLSGHALVNAAVPEQSMALMSVINSGLVDTGACPPPPDWDLVREQARLDQRQRSEQTKAAREQARLDDEAFQAMEDEYFREIEQAILEAEPLIAQILGLEVSSIPATALHYLCEYWVHNGFTQGDEHVIKAAWDNKDWDRDDVSSQEPHDDDLYLEGGVPFSDHDESACDGMAADDPRRRLADQYHGFVKPGESWWSLERNAAAAGFHRVETYLEWRHSDQAD